MIKNILTPLALAALMSAGVVQAGDFGTEAEAKAMLERAVAALKQDEAKALAMFTKGEGGFKDRDLYPYCGGPDGMFTAHPKLMGKSMKDLKDKTGVPIGEEIYAKAADNKMIQLTYMWPRPDSTDPVQKVVWVTKVGPQICAVGYYK